MKLSKNKEKELMQVYEAYWAEYLNGNVDAMQSLLDDSYTQIGSAEGEVFASKKEAVQFLVDTIDQVAGKLEMRNRSTKLEQLDHLILIHEVCDLYALADKKWIFYSKFRASTLLQDKKEGWKITHQHSSFPDTKTEEGQNVAIEKIAEENKELREAVKRRTVELEQKNRELQIEAALERVRARTMAMHKSDELKEVIQVVYDQFILLNINIEHTGFIIDYRQNDIMHIWLTDRREVPSEVTIPYFDTAHWNSFNEAKEEGLDFFTNKLDFEEKNRFYKELFKLIPGVPDETIDHYLKVPGLAISTVLLDDVGLYIENFDGIPYTDNENKILLRIGKVFQQTYTRFLDLQKAEAQAREAKIETALEKVRAGMMAMHKSDELRLVIKTIFEQLQGLDFGADASAVIIYDENNGAEHWFSGYANETYPKSYTIPYIEKFSYNTDLVDAWKNGVKYQAFPMEGKQKTDYGHWVLENTDFKDLPEEFTINAITPDRLVLNDAFNKYGMLEVLGPEALSEENAGILKRFSKVFEQTYTRFLDLQKAEAQAREASIEAALERVRSRSMAMHKSEELADLSLELVKQVQALGVATWFCAFNIYDEDQNGSLEWGSNGEGTFPKYRTPREGVFLRYYEAGQRGETFLINEIGENECATHYDYLCSLPGVGEQLLKMKGAGIPFPKSQIDHVAYFKYGYILFITYEPTPESHDVFKRFAKVFQQTYTRFLDLQKAEAQAREALIEAALEKVRTASMTMQKGEELAEVISVVFTQLKALGIDSEGCGLNLYDKEEGMDMWMSGFGEDVHPKSFHISFFDHPYYEVQLNDWKNKEKYRVLAFEGNLKRSFDQQTFSNKDFFELPKDIKETFLAKEKVISSVAYMKYGMLEMIGDEALSESQGEILCRFANVFEQAYTRFLDIQQAEVQAREAQIETALERVRSRSMAMHKSEELADLSLELVKQVQALGVATWFCAFNIYDEDQSGSLEWGSNGEGTFPKYRTPREGIFLRYYKAGQKGETFLINEIGENECASHYDYLCSLPGVGEQLLKMKDSGISFPTSQIDHVAFFKYGYIIFITYEPVPAAHDIFKRFANVFQQTYTRFLDLQKAEAQARESQIETAMERIRSRAIAMRTSNELLEVALEIRIQTDLLGQQDLELSVVHLYEKNAEYFESLAAMRTPGSEGEITTHKMKFPVDATPEIQQMMKNYWAGLSQYTIELNLKQREAWQKVLETTVPDLFDQRLQFDEDEIAAEKKEYWNFTDFSGGSLLTVTYSPPTTETKELFRRAADVFDLAYRRYGDLKKAEAQAREAQIEAALERVRSKTMAMHNSADVGATVVSLSDEVLKLGLDTSIRVGIGILEGYEGMETWSANPTPNGEVDLKMGMLDMTIHPMLIGLKKAWKSGKRGYSYDYIGDDVFRYYEALNNEPEYPFQADLDSLPENEYHKSFFYTEGILFSFAPNPISEAAAKVLARFAKVFGQTYRRYLDLQKAEAQAREAEIEATLEKVRSRTMAMHKSEELAETALVLYEQFSVLGNIPDRMSIGIFKEETKEIEIWSTDQSGSQLDQRYSGSWERSAVMTKLYKAWKSGNDSFVEDLSGQKLKAWLKFIREELKLFVDGSNIKGRRVQQAAFFSHGMLLFTTNEPVTDEIMQLLVRFAKVFSQTYTRFLDLQKAEAQAREAQIENALEKVRSRTMAMHNSNELREVVGEFFRQAEQLGFEIQMFVIFIFKPNGGLEWWGTEFGEEGLPQSYDIPPLKEFKSYPRGRNLIELRKGKKPYDVYELTGKECKIWTKILLEKTGLKQLPARIKKRLKSVDKIVLSDAVCKYGIIEVAGPVVLSREKGEILQRFAKVFEQTYTRFLDVQKAEAQAREAQIETALERVRSRTMAMQKSDELLDAAEILSAELVNLEIPHFMSGFVLINETAEKQGVHMGVPGKGRQAKFYLPLKGDAVLKKRYKSWKNAEPIFYQRVEGEKLAAHMAYVTQHFGSDEMVETGRKIPDPVIFYCGNFKEGYLHILSEVYLNEEQESILARFTKIFQQTYTRFLDLQKAEAQAREAQIENALEKVRSRTMAMQNSYELPEAANDLFLQVQALGIPAWSAGYCIWETKDKKAASCNMSSEGEIQKSFILPTIGEGYNFYDPLQKGETFYVEELGGDALVKHYNFMRTLPTVGKILDELIAAGLSLPTFQIFHILYFPQGYLMFITYEQVPDAHEIFKRFAKVFEQTYTRFLDLQKAEAQAREATKQASLDRVRGQIASMRTAADLERITPLVWNELTTMEVPFIRCGVFIMHEPKEIVEVYLSAPDGHSLGVLHLQFNADPLTANTVAHWRKGTIFKEHWNRDEFLSWTKSLIEQGQISNIKTYQGAANPPESLNLHFIPFTQGMLYVGSENPLNVEQIELVQSLADAFAIAYARYEDFTKLEKAKESVEKTLTELKATQNQLVQSEKMASLGELTAGIAHEIQNPLNFVNNFSEVSKELLEEMMEEFEKGDKEEAFAIVEDIKRNLEKINHHGQRADGIVKGMLQHSSTSSGEKEPTDINVLADEYLRLAYHGLRAKDKSFNATMKTAYDDSLEKVNVIPQDIGRVILNLITNAFYACTERSRSATNEKSSSANSSKEALAKLEASGDTKYEPTVTVSTKKTKEGVEIRVKDNGNGIPEGIKEKIFQPFFTTKPTGQGTGLGLSLSYDIVKAHGGELKVETKEGKGTEFKMKLPI